MEEKRLSEIRNCQSGLQRTYASDRLPQQKTPISPHTRPSLIPHDIILANIGAVLYLDDLERDAAGVSELVLRCLRDEYGLALVEHGSLLAARDLGGAAAVPLRFLRLLQQKVFKDAINFRTGHDST